MSVCANCEHHVFSHSLTGCTVAIGHLGGAKCPCPQEFGRSAEPIHNCWNCGHSLTRHDSAGCLGQGRSGGVCGCLIAKGGPAAEPVRDQQVGGVVLSPYGSDSEGAEPSDCSTGYGVLGVAGVDVQGVRNNSAREEDAVRSPRPLRGAEGSNSGRRPEVDPGSLVRGDEVREPFSPADTVQGEERGTGFRIDRVRREEAGANSLQSGSRVHRGDDRVGQAEGQESVPPVPGVQSSGLGARDHQVGGLHYRKYRIQPWDLWEEYELDAFTGAVLKYLLRDKGNRLEDLRKARHTLDRLIEIEERKDGT